MNTRALLIFGLVATFLPHSVVGQGIVVDQGDFAVSIDGRAVGTERFVIRRAGIGRADVIFATGTVALRVGGAPQEIRPLLRADLPDGIAAEYEVSVTGPDQMELVLRRAGRRYVATISSAIGAENREFRGLPDTRVVEKDVAHLYYFLRDVREGRAVHALEPRGRRQLTLTAGAHVEVELRVARNLVQARRVEFSEGDDRRIVWYDRQGRVLRVEVPATRYVAERTDIVG